MSLVPDVSNWRDITTDFSKASQELKTGELINVPGFDLFSGVESLEVSVFFNLVGLNKSLSCLLTLF